VIGARAPHGVRRALLLLVLGGCSRPPGLAGTGQQADSAPGARPVAAASAPVASTAPPPAPLLPDGCYSRVGVTLAPRAKLDELAAQCISGMQPLLPKPAAVQLVSGRTQEIAFSITDASRCVRAIAAGDQNVTDLELSVVDEAGQSFGQDELSGSVALALGHGPFCVPRPGNYRALLRAPTAAGRAVVQVWQAE
jgi:hypothetical protein